MNDDTIAPQRFPAEGLVRFAATVLQQAGLAHEPAQDTAEILVEGDLMGHTTHGLQLLAPYVAGLKAGTMETKGEPDVVADSPSSLTWDGRFLPGPWLVRRAMKVAFERSASQPVVTVVIRRSHHIAALAAYLKEATDRGLVMLLTCSDPAVASVTPFGGHAGRYTPNPIAAGFPTDGLPVLIDISASTTTNGMVARMNRRGEKLASPWLVDNQGEPSTDPAVMFTDPPGAILPLGGVEQGYKGYALGLLVEALTSALGGHGRADGDKRWGANVFLQVINPAAFGGLEAFKRETGWLADACRNTPAREARVRMPGERALALRQAQLEIGVALHDDVLAALGPLTRDSGVPLPATMG